MKTAGERPAAVPVCVATGPGDIGRRASGARCPPGPWAFPDGQVYAQLGGAAARSAQFPARNRQG